MIEQAYTFGSRSQLNGIISEAAPLHEKNKNTALIILNAGLLNKPGPFRLNTLLARETTKIGMTAFRFDISGIGDSNKHQDSRPRDEQIIDDIQDAMDFIETNKGISQFIILGLCTGADNAHKISLIDKRVVGAIFMDGYAYPTTKYHLKRWLKKITKPRKIRNKLWHSVKNLSQQDKREIDYFWTLPEKEKTEQELNKLIDRKVKMLFIFTASWPTFLYEGQIKDSFKSVNFKNCLQVNYFPEAHHLFVRVDDRDKLITTIMQWLKNKF